MKTAQVYLDLVKKYFPSLSDVEADKILWNSTPFPMRDDIPTIESYLIQRSLDISFEIESLSNSTRFAEFLDGLSEDQYNNFEENIKGDLQKYE